MENSSRFFKNTECKYYPCHKDNSGTDKVTEEINCLFCYCPLYHMDPCPGDNRYIEKDGKKIKVCTNCSFPHKPENYDRVIEILKRG